MARKRNQFRKIAVPTPRNGCRELILMDEQPIRNKVLGDCKTVMRQIKKTTKEWNRFNNKDKPAFTRWFHREFGPLLNDIQAAGADLDQKRLLVEEVERAAYWGGITYRMAYESVMREREDSCDNEIEEEWDSEGGPEDPFMEQEKTEREMLEQLFHELFGIDPESNPDLFEKVFNEAKNSGFYGEQEGPGTFKGRRVPNPEKENPAEKSYRTRVKELYRLLARSLHPDAQGEEDPRKRDLWHQEQEAYEKRDLEGLETLRALTNIETGKMAEDTGIFHLKQVWRQLKNSLNAIRASLRRAKKDPAWGFATRKETSSLRKTIHRELRAELEKLKIRHQELEDLISKWAKPRRTGRKASTVSKRHGGKKQQLEFPF